MNPIPNIKDYKKKFVSNRKKEKQSVIKGINSTYISMVGLISILFIYYVFTLNTHATAGYQIREIENKINDLVYQNNTINAKIFELSSSSNINKNEFIKKQMVKEIEHNNLVIKQGVQYVFNNNKN